MTIGSDYEELIIRIPKAMMDLLRQFESKLRITPQEYAEKSVAEMVNADTDANPTLKIDHDK